MVWPTNFDTKECNSRLPIPMPAVTKLEHLINLDLNAPPGYTRLTAIMATVSPSTCDPVVLENMMAAGVNMVRLNTSFDTIEKRAEMVKSLRSASRSYGQKMGYVFSLAIALDLRGPVVRTGYIDYGLGGMLNLEAGNTINLTTDETYLDKGSYNAVYVNYPNFSFMVRRGQFIYIDNELLKLRVESVAGSSVNCRVERGGQLFSRRDVKIPGAHIDLPIFSEYDKEDISFAVHNQLDMVIASYVEKPESMQELRNLLGEKGQKIAIVCKIQTMKALNNLNELMEASDSIIIARQELGTDIAAEKLIRAQKNIASRAMAIGKSCGIMAQVLQSMSYEKIPLRAEILDAGNCVLDGVDYVVLSAETASGPRPVEAVAVLAEVLKEAQGCVWPRTWLDHVDQVHAPCSPGEAVSLAASLSAIKFAAAAVIVTTTSGRAAALMARFRPCCPVLAVTRHLGVARQLHMYRGVVPLLYEEPSEPDWSIDLQRRIKHGYRFGLACGILKIGDPVIIISGCKHGQGFADALWHDYVQEVNVATEKK